MSDISKQNFIDKYEREVAEYIRSYLHDETMSWLTWYAADARMQSDLNRYREMLTKIESQDSFKKEDAEFICNSEDRLDLLQKVIDWLMSQPAGFKKDEQTPLLDKLTRHKRASQFRANMDLRTLPHIEKAFEGHTIKSILKYVEEKSAEENLDEKIRNYWATDLLMKYCELKRQEAVETLQKEWNTLLNRTATSSKIQFAKERTKYRNLFPNSTL